MFDRCPVPTTAGQAFKHDFDERGRMRCGLTVMGIKNVGRWSLLLHERPANHHPFGPICQYPDFFPVMDSMSIRMMAMSLNLSSEYL